MKNIQYVLITCLLIAGCATQKTIPATPLQPSTAAEQKADSHLLQSEYRAGTINSWGGGQRQVIDGQEKISYYLIFDFEKKDTIQPVSTAIAHKLQQALKTESPVVITPLIRWTYERDIPDEFYRKYGKELLQAVSQEMYALCTNELPKAGLEFEYVVEGLPQVHHGHFSFTTKRTDSMINEALRTLTMQKCAACFDRLMQELEK